MEEYKVKVEVINNQVKMDQDVTITTGNLNSIKMVFNLPTEYEGLTISAIFISEGIEHKVPILNNECVLPFNSLNEGIVEFGVYAFKGNVLIYSPKMTKFEVKLGSYTKNNGEDFNMSDYDIWLQEATKLYNKMVELQDTIIKNSSEEAYNKLLENEDYKNLNQKIDEFEKFKDDNDFIIA